MQQQLIQALWCRLAGTAVVVAMGPWTMAGAAARQPAAPPAPTAGAAEPAWSYRIARGDTLIGLHARWMRADADWRVVQRLNRITEPGTRRLVPGSVMQIPLALLRPQPVAAEVLHVHGQVSLERAGRPAEPLSAATVLRGYDQIVTGVQSFASLRFADGSRSLLGPESRLRIASHGTLGGSGVVDTRLQLERGSTDTQVPPGGAVPRLQIQTPVVNLAVRGTEFRTRFEAGRATGEVLRGQVAFGALALDAGFGSVATASGSLPPRPLLPAPVIEGLPTQLDQLPLQLSLPALPAGAAAYRLLLVAADAAPTAAATEDPRRFDLRVAGPVAEWPDTLPDGRYELRLRLVDADGLEGLEARQALRIQARPVAPQLQRPAAGERLPEAAVTLAWTPPPAPLRSRLQVASRADFDAPLVDQAGLTESSLTVTLPTGTLWWRLASQRSDGEQGPWSPARPLQRIDPPPPAPPAGLTLRASDDALWVSWQPSPVPGARYQLQLSAQPDFATLLLDQTTAEPGTQWAAPSGGLCHARVRVIDAQGRPGPFSPVQQLRLPIRPGWWWLLPPLPPL